MELGGRVTRRGGWWKDAIQGQRTVEHGLAILMAQRPDAEGKATNDIGTAGVLSMRWDVKVVVIVK